jgi:2-oxoglutarate ferredoxin oxidoreductase subunit beta
VKILLFNNQIYGLTKGQYSPTSPLGTRNKSTPMGSLDYPFNPVSIALGAEATFVARSIDTDKKHLTEVLRRAAAHKGSSLVEIYQNCNVYNDGAFEAVKEHTENQIRLVHGEPITFGEEGEHGVKLRDDGSCELVAADEGDLLVHDEHQEVGSLAFALSRISHTPHGPTPIGIFRDVERPVYDELMAGQLETARSERGEGDLKSLIHAGDTWVV